MIELILMCALGKPTTPCPPPPPPPVEILVGLPAKEVELVKETPERPVNPPK